MTPTTIDGVLYALDEAMHACCDSPLSGDFMTLTRSWRAILEDSAAATSTTNPILLDILVERDAQDQQWGGPEHDATHKAIDWHTYRRKFEQRALSVPGRRRDSLVKIAALALAQIEALDRAESSAPLTPSGAAPT